MLKTIISLGCYFAATYLWATYTVFVGSYTDHNILAHQPASNIPGKGLYILSMDHSGVLKLESTVQCQNPAVLTVSPDHSHLYALSEGIQENGFIDVFKILNKKNLDHQQRYYTKGRSTCGLSFSPKSHLAIITNYWDSVIDVVHIKNYLFGKPQKTFQQQHRSVFRQVTSREDHWQNRQVGPHAHAVHFWKEWVFIPDLGENAVFQYRLNKTGLTKEVVFHLPEGSGPRHLVLHHQLNIAYLSNELNSSVAVLTLDDSEPTVTQTRLSLAQQLSSKSSQSSTQTNYVSEIALSKDQRFLYVANRGHDTLAVFKVDPSTGQLHYKSSIKTNGECPRHFAITPCNRFLIVANQDSNSITVFDINSNTGDLTIKHTLKNIGSPNYITVLKQ